MKELTIFIIAGALSSGAQFVLYKYLLPKLYKNKKVPTYWQVPIPVLLFLISNTMYTDKMSLLGMFIAYIAVYAVLTAVYIAVEFHKIDEDAKSQK